MSDYTKTTTFDTKDDLPPDNPNKVIKGSEFETEFDNIATAIATKANKISGGTANNVIEQDANGDLVDTGLATPTGAFVGTTDTQTLTNKTLTSPTIGDASNIVAATTSVVGVTSLATAAEVTAGTETTKAVTPAALAGLNDNTAAWVCFQGTGTVTIRDDYNVDSITDNGTGQYTVNFTNDMTDTNYAILLSDDQASPDGAKGLYDSTRTVSSFNMVTVQKLNNGDAAEFYDTDYVSAAVFSTT